MALVVTQALLGAATIWSNKAADIATAHVLIGALSLALGTVLYMAGLVSHRTQRGLLVEAAPTEFVGRVPTDSSGFGYSLPQFPLTLALSPGERQPRRRPAPEPQHAGLDGKRAPRPPLPVAAATLQDNPDRPTS